MRAICLSGRFSLLSRAPVCAGMHAIANGIGQIPGMQLQMGAANAVNQHCESCLCRYVKVFLCKAIIHVEMRNMQGLSTNRSGDGTGTDSNLPDTLDMEVDVLEDPQSLPETKAPESSSVFSR